MSPPPPAGPPLYMLSIIAGADGELVGVTYPYYTPTSAHGTNSDNNSAIMTRTRELQVNDVVRLLGHATGLLGVGTIESMRLLTDQSQRYTVTPGTTAKLIMILSSLATTRFRIWETDNADSIAGGVLKYEYDQGGFTNNRLVTICPEWDIPEKTFAAGKYITIEVVTGTANVFQAITIES